MKNWRAGRAKVAPGSAAKLGFEGKLGANALRGSMDPAEYKSTTWRLGKMSLAIRGIEGRIEQGDTLLNRFPYLKADYILANPPFNMKNWGGEHLR